MFANRCERGSAQRTGALLSSAIDRCGAPGAKATQTSRCDEEYLTACAWRAATSLDRWHRTLRAHDGQRTVHSTRRSRSGPLMAPKLRDNPVEDSRWRRRRIRFRYGVWRTANVLSQTACERLGVESVHLRFRRLLARRRPAPQCRCRVCSGNRTGSAVVVASLHKRL